MPRSERVQSQHFHRGKAVEKPETLRLSNVLRLVPQLRNTAALPGAVLAPDILTGPGQKRHALIHINSFCNSLGMLAFRARPSAQVRRRLICSSIVLASGTVCESVPRINSVLSSFLA